MPLRCHRTTCNCTEDVVDGELTAADLAAVRLLDELLATAGSCGDYVASSACMQPTLDLINFLCTCVLGSAPLSFSIQHLHVLVHVRVAVSFQALPGAVHTRTQ